MTHTNNFVS